MFQLRELKDEFMVRTSEASSFVDQRQKRQFGDACVRILFIQDGLTEGNVIYG